MRWHWDSRCLKVSIPSEIAVLKFDFWLTCDTTPLNDHIEV